MASSQLLRCQGQDDTTLRKLTMFYAMALATTDFAPQASAHTHLKSDFLATNSQGAVSPQALMFTGIEENAATYSDVEVMDGNHKVMLWAKPQPAVAAQSVERITKANSALLSVPVKLAAAVARWA